MSGPRFDVLVLGAGTAGCVLASRLSEEPERSVCLVEAGPDYGPTARPGRRRCSTAGCRRAPTTGATASGRLRAARIIGGCSSHNTCTLVRGAPADYAAWGDDGWTYEALTRPYFDRAERQLDPLRFGRDGLRTLVSARRRRLRRARDPGARGLQLARRDRGSRHGAGQRRGTTRWNAAFAYLDPARERPNLTVMGDTMVDQVRSSTAAPPGRPSYRRRPPSARISSSLCAGAYGSPAVLLRSGVGPGGRAGPARRAAGGDLPVGERLLDHFGIPIRWAPRRRSSKASFTMRGPLSLGQGLVKGRSSDCPEGLWDLQLLIGVFPANGRPAEPGGFVLSASAMLVQPEWRGSVRLRSRDPAMLPEVTEYSLDSDRDLGHALEAVELCAAARGRGAAAGPRGKELAPGADAADGDRSGAAGAKGSAPSSTRPATCAMGRWRTPEGRVPRPRGRGGGRRLADARDPAQRALS